MTFVRKFGPAPGTSVIVTVTPLNFVPRKSHFIQCISRLVFYNELLYIKTTVNLPLIGNMFYKLVSRFTNGLE